MTCPVVSHPTKPIAGPTANTGCAGGIGANLKLEATRMRVVRGADAGSIALLGRHRLSMNGPDCASSARFGSRAIGPRQRCPAPSSRHSCEPANPRSPARRTPYSRRHPASVATVSGGKRTSTSGPYWPRTTTVSAGGPAMDVETARLVLRRPRLADVPALLPLLG